MVAGKDEASTQTVVGRVKQIPKVSKVLLAHHDTLEHQMSDRIALIAQDLISKGGNSYTSVMAASTNIGKEIIPRLSGYFNSQAVTDVIQVLDESTFQRPTYAGNAVATVRTRETLKFLTVRPTNFEKLEEIDPSHLPSVELVPTDVLEKEKDSLVQFVSEEVVKSDKPELASAKFVVFPVSHL